MLTNQKFKAILPPKGLYLLIGGFLLVLLPAIILGILVFRYSVNLPFWDQWLLMPQLFSKINSDGYLSFSDLIAQHNESRKLFPRLIFLSLGYLTHWDVRAEMLAIFMLACWISVSIYVLNRQTVDGSKVKGLIIAFLTNLLIFSTIQYDNWFWGIQLVVFMPIACLTATILIAYSSLSTPVKHLNCLVLGIISTFSYANGLLSWILFPFILILTDIKSWSELRQKKLLFIPWVFFFISTLIIYFSDYERPEASPSFLSAIVNPVKTGQFFLVFLGYPLGAGIKEDQIAVSTAIGFIEIVILSGIILYLLKQFKNYALFHRTIGWFALAFYAIFSAAITAAGRSGFGLEWSLYSKYTTFSIYMLVALIHLTVIVADDFTSQKAEVRVKKSKNLLAKISLFAATISLLILHWQSFNYGIVQIKEWYSSRMLGKTCLAFINLVDKEPCITGNLLGNYSYVLAMANQLNDLGFVKPSLVTDTNIEKIAASSSDNWKYGNLDGIEKIDNALYVASGWAILPHRNEPADGVILTYEDGGGKSVIFDLFLPTKTLREAVAKILKNPAYLESGWYGTFSQGLLPVEKVVKISAWAYDTKNGKAYKLANDLLIGNS